MSAHGSDTYMTLAQFSLVEIMRTPCVLSSYSLQGRHHAIIVVTCLLHVVVLGVVAPGEGCL